MTEIPFSEIWKFVILIFIFLSLALFLYFFVLTIDVATCIPASIILVVYLRITDKTFGCLKEIWNTENKFIQLTQF